MRISDWSSDVCSSDLVRPRSFGPTPCLEIARSGEKHDSDPEFREIGGKSDAVAVATQAHIDQGQRRTPSLRQRDRLRTEERRVGKVWVSTVRLRWERGPQK